MSHRDRLKLIGGIALKILINPVMISTFAGLLYSTIAYSVDPTHDVPMIVSLPFKWLSDCMYGIGLFNVCCPPKSDWGASSLEGNTSLCRLYTSV
jgi:hypothetical protein